MSNDNDPRDEAMREIEAALEILIDRAAVGRRVADQRVKVLALIRSKLPQPDAEHERAVEAWRDRAGRFRVWSETLKAWFYDIGTFDEALRLMRARPASGKDEAAGELLRAAVEAWPWVYGHPKQSDELWQAIAKAERAGIKP